MTDEEWERIRPSIEEEDRAHRALMSAQGSVPLRLQADYWLAEVRLKAALAELGAGNAL